MADATLTDLKIFHDIQNVVRRRINNRNQDFSKNLYEAELNELLNLLERSIQTRESNSALILGPPGCGKTALVKYAVKELKNKGIIKPETCIVVELNGIIHTDDRISLLEIARQFKCYEFSDSVAKKSFSENLSHLLNELRVDGTQPYILFILDTFHLFTEHKNQILLYNLFDFVQSSKAPICVLGLTICTDIMEMLEKRVLSRFSHRIIQMNRRPAVEHYINTFLEVLTIRDDDLKDVERIYIDLWNNRIRALSESNEVKETFNQLLTLDANQSKFRNLLFSLFKNISFEEPLITVDCILEVFRFVDETVITLSELSLLEISLVVAAKHRVKDHDGEPFNFEMLLKYYLKFVAEYATNMVSERPVVFKAFQRLQSLDILKSFRKIDGTRGKLPIQYDLFQLNCTEEQVLDAVRINKNVSAGLSSWAQNQTVS